MGGGEESEFKVLKLLDGEAKVTVLAENFTVEVMTGKYLDLYDQILGGEKDSADEVEPRAVA